MIKTNEEKFWSRVSKQGPNDCWPWIGAKHPTGYGKIWLNLPDRVCKPAHHAALLLTGVDVPKGTVVMHSCDNPSCVNPAHLSKATQQLNIRDKVLKGRQPTGDKHHNTKISEEDVKYIRSSSKTGKALAAELGVTPSAISNIRNFKKRI